MEIFCLQVLKPLGSLHAGFYCVANGRHGMSLSGEETAKQHKSSQEEEKHVDVPRF